MRLRGPSSPAMATLGPDRLHGLHILARHSAKSCVSCLRCNNRVGRPFAEATGPFARSHKVPEQKPRRSSKLTTASWKKVASCRRPRFIHSSDSLAADMVDGVPGNGALRVGHGALVGPLIRKPGKRGQRRALTFHKDARAIKPVPAHDYCRVHRYRARVALKDGILA